MYIYTSWRPSTGSYNETLIYLYQKHCVCSTPCLWWQTPEDRITKHKVRKTWHLEKSLSVLQKTQPISVFSITWCTNVSAFHSFPFSKMSEVSLLRSTHWLEDLRSLTQSRAGKKHQVQLWVSIWHRSSDPPRTAQLFSITYKSLLVCWL